MRRPLTKAEQVIEELKPYLRGGIGVDAEVKDNGQLIRVDISLTISDVLASDNPISQGRVQDMLDKLDRVRKTYLIDVDCSYQKVSRD